RCRPSSSVCRRSLHDALPIYGPQVAAMGVEQFGHVEMVAVLLGAGGGHGEGEGVGPLAQPGEGGLPNLLGAARLRRGGRGCWHRDRKSTRLNSSHQIISYAVV